MFFDRFCTLINIGIVLVVCPYVPLIWKVMQMEVFLSELELFKGNIEMGIDLCNI